MSGHIATSASVDWNTPKEVVDLILQVFPRITMDPCSNKTSLVPSERKLFLEDDGLHTDWATNSQSDSYVYVNPPFGRIWINKERTKTSTKKVEGWESSSIKDWIEFAFKFSGHRDHVLALCPASVDTRHWQEFIFTANATGAARICFLKGRLQFVGAKAKCPMAMSLILFSQNKHLQDRFYEVFSKVGYVI